MALPRLDAEEEITTFFILVPYGEPPPTEWMERHPDWIKIPAIFVSHEPVPLTIGGTGSAAERAYEGAAIPTAIGAPVGPARPEAQFGRTPPLLAPTTLDTRLPVDPIAVYRRMTDAMNQSAANGLFFAATGTIRERPF